MAALNSNLGIIISPDPNINFALRRPQALRLPSENAVTLVRLSYPRQNLAKASLASGVVLLKMRDNKSGFKCRNSIQDAETFVESKGGQFSKNLIRRKRLAVFVSGGGSNFRSIHEATLGDSVHGDVMVLVTDKPGTVFLAWHVDLQRDE